jgi:type IV pilus assembly protein PilN
MIKINLLPPVPRRRFTIRLPALPGLGLLFGALYAAAIVLVGGYWVMLGAESRALTADIARMEVELTRQKAAIEEGNRFKREKEDLERRLAVIELIARNQSRPIYLLDAVADMVPPDVWLTALEEREQALKVAGQAYSTTAVADFMANLRRSGKFKDVDLLISRQDLAKTPRLVTFEVTCRFDI